jgi:hypothetical protein
MTNDSNPVMNEVVDLEESQPRWPISMFDRWQGGLARTARRIEHFLAAIFLPRRHHPK